MAEVTQLGAWQIAFWWLAGTAAVASGLLLFGGQHRRQTADLALAWWLWHWFTGGALEGSRTFPGLDDEARPAARAARRGVLAAARTTAAVAAGAVWYVHAGALRGTAVGTVVGMGGMCAAVAAAATLGIVWAARRAAHYLQWERSLHLAVHSLLGWDRDKWPLSYLTVPRDRAETGVIVGYPPGFDLKDGHCQAVENMVRRKLDLGDVVPTWVAAGRHQYLMLRERDPMPETCYYRDPAIRALVAQARRSAPVVGVRRGGKAVTVDLESESPHVLISAGSGGGKSETVKSIVAQLMASGAIVMMIDFKRHSHPWLKGIKGVHYARNIRDIHYLLVSVAREGQRRNEAWDDVGIDEPGPTFPRLVLVCEEMTVTMSKLRRWWKTRPVEDRHPGDPSTSPAIEALEDIACMGRQVRIHIIAVAQMATAKSIGGSEIRENFAYRIMGRYTKRAWEMLVPECDFTPASRRPGRMQVCVGGEATEVHALLMTDEQARELALTGATAPQRDSTPVAQGERPVAATAGPDPELDAPPPEVELIDLRQAVETGLLVITLANLRTCRARDPQFPAAVVRRGGTDMYDPGQLAYWARNRPREIETTRV